MMKIFVLAFALVPTLTLAQFADVSSAHENAEAIEYMQDEGIIEGYADGTFRPENRINRAEFTKIIMGAQFSQSQINACRTGINAFSDVSASDWFAPFVCLAKQRDIVGGYPDGTFGPANEIVFSEAAKIIVETFGLPTEDLNPWYAPYAQVLSDRRAIPMSMNSPSKAITRGEMAEMVWRVKTDNRSQSGTRFSFTTRAEVETTENQIDTSNNGAEAVLALVNAAREAKGISALRFNTILQKVAQDYAERMNEEGFFDHVDPQGTTPADRVTAAGYTYRSTAENIAKGQSSAPQVFDTWKSSPGHWQNIMNSAYEEIGIGQAEVTDEEFYRGYYWVQVFGTKLR